jgi:hypothetical protein
MSFGQIVRRARNYEAEFIFFQRFPEIYRARHRGHSPLFSLLCYTGVKHFVRQAIGFLPYGIQSPWSYLRFLVACGLERIYLLYLLPRYCWKHP